MQTLVEASWSEKQMPGVCHLHRSLPSDKWQLSCQPHLSVELSDELYISSGCIHRATFLSFLAGPFSITSFLLIESKRLGAFYALHNRQVDDLVDHIQGLYIATI